MAFDITDYIKTSTIDVSSNASEGSELVLAEDGNAADPISARRNTIVAVYVPSGFEGNNVLFKMPDKNGNWKYLRAEGLRVKVAVTPDEWSQVDRNIFELLPKIKPVSDVAESQDRELQFILGTY